MAIVTLGMWFWNESEIQRQSNDIVPEMQISMPLEAYDNVDIISYYSRGGRKIICEDGTPISFYTERKY